MPCIKIRYVWWANHNNWYKTSLILAAVTRVTIHRINSHLSAPNETRTREKLKAKCWEKKLNDRRNNSETVRSEMSCTT